jgi:6-phosphogluconate dehydrogenase
MADTMPTPQPEVAMVGLGRMGAAMAHRLAAHGHAVAVHDLSTEVTEATAAKHDLLHPATSLADAVATLGVPRRVWVMVPAGAATAAVVDELAALLDPQDVVINGGNCRWTDSMVYAERLGCRYLDVGVSGGVWGFDDGYCLMAGGDPDTYAEVEPLLQDLAPQGGAAHVGGVGAGHFTKMVHNGIEYGLMQAYAEGFHLLKDSGFDLDLDQIARLWQHGSVVRSWLLELLIDVLDDEPRLASIAPVVADAGEGRWTVEAAIDRGVPTPVIAASLFARMTSQQDGYGERVLAALRERFGGHEVLLTTPESGRDMAP